MTYWAQYSKEEIDSMHGIVVEDNDEDVSNEHEEERAHRTYAPTLNDYMMSITDFM